LEALKILDWDAIQAHDWRDALVRSHKNSEFLVEERVPIALLEEIGVYTEAMKVRVSEMIQTVSEMSQIPVVLHPEWYY